MIEALAQCCDHFDQNNEARKLFLEADQRFGRTAAKSDCIARNLIEYSEFLYKLQEYQEVIRILEQIWPDIVSWWPAEHTNSIRTADLLALCYLNVGRPSHAEKLLESVIENWEQSRNYDLEVILAVRLTLHRARVALGKEKPGTAFRNSRAVYGVTEDERSHRDPCLSRPRLQTSTVAVSAADSLSLHRWAWVCNDGRGDVGIRRG